jgi:16S rRNA C967 or C1407 C5-methylase (RsmB/RsmF family)
MKGRFTTVRDAVVKEVVTPVNWCSDTWQVNCDSTTLAKDEAFTPLHSLLMREIRSCHLVRQELVSMIPAILLDPQSHHCTLDMCAAPGSKTEQLISRVCVSSAGGTVPPSLLLLYLTALFFFQSRDHQWTGGCQ